VGDYMAPTEFVRGEIASSKNLTHQKKQFKLGDKLLKLWKIKL